MDKPRQQNTAKPGSSSNPTKPGSNRDDKYAQQPKSKYESGQKPPAKQAEPDKDPNKRK